MGYQGSVLVVDDEIGPRESLRMILHPLYEVYTAAGGEEAIDCIQKKTIDLVTLDMNMPGVSGLEVLREIKKRNVEVDVIIISGYLNSQSTQEAKNFGAVDVISKPFNVTDIIASVGKLVERKRFQREVNNLIQTAKDLGAIDHNQAEKILYN